MEVYLEFQSVSLLVFGFAQIQYLACLKVCTDCIPGNPNTPLGPETTSIFTWTGIYLNSFLAEVGGVVESMLSV